MPKRAMPRVFKRYRQLATQLIIACVVWQHGKLLMYVFATVSPAIADNESVRDCQKLFRRKKETSVYAANRLNTQPGIHNDIVIIFV